MLNDLVSFCRSNPDRTAFVDSRGTRKVTCGEFIGIAGRISNLLRKKCSPGDAVAIDLGRCAEHIAARYAALAAGMVSVSLSESYPLERKEGIISASAAKAVIGSEFMEECRDCPEDFYAGDFPDSDPGYIAFTSGSTGKPKGVVHKRSVFPHIDRCWKLCGEDPSVLKFAALSDFSFIASMTEIQATLLSGAEIHIVNRDDVKDPKSLIGYFKTTGISWTLMNPGMYKALWQYLDLKICVLAGEASGTIRVKPGTDVINDYG
ncbi:MAG: AMP-binding protein, partial [Candidatus Methanomethylophilaceae archaeon]|nr:AMP-binding protein [Candidatus Methanomethylophilaceae archaeon]